MIVSVYIVPPHVSLSSMPIPSDGNITGKKMKCLSKIHKNIELYDSEIILLSILQLLDTSTPQLLHPDYNNQVGKIPIDG